LGVSISSWITSESILSGTKNLRGNYDLLGEWLFFSILISGIIYQIYKVTFIEPSTDTPTTNHTPTTNLINLDNIDSTNNDIVIYKESPDPLDDSEYEINIKIKKRKKYDI
jgi:hypothetical protein